MYVHACVRVHVCIWVHCAETVFSGEFLGLYARDKTFLETAAIVCMSVCMCVCMPVCMSVCMSVCMCDLGA